MSQGKNKILQLIIFACFFLMLNAFLGHFQQTIGSEQGKQASELLSNIIITIIAIYSFSWSIASLLLIIGIWPNRATLTEEEIAIRLLWHKTVVSNERLILFIVIVMGALGGGINTVWDFADTLAEGNFKNNLLIFYLLKPFIGILISLIFYFLLRGGILTGSGASKEINLYGIAGLSGVIGFFSRDVAFKLANIVKLFFAD